MDTPTIYDVSRLSGVSTATVSALPTQRHSPGHGPAAD